MQTVAFESALYCGVYAVWRGVAITVLPLSPSSQPARGPGDTLLEEKEVLEAEKGSCSGVL